MATSRLCVPLLLIVFVSQVKAQHFALSRLFYPNVTLRADYMPSANMGNNQSYGLSRTSFNALIPLRSEVDVSFSLRKKFDLRARHFLMLANASQINPTINNTISPANGYKTASVGVLMLQASLRDRLWIYGGGLGITETNETFFTPQPFFWAGGARMRILGLHTQIAYGTALIFNQKVRLIPIFGFNKRINKQWRASGLLPFRVDVNHRINEWFNIDMIGSFDGYSAGFQHVTSLEKSLRRSNYQHVKFSVAANAHLFTVFNVSLEAGLGTFRQLRTFNSARENLGTERPNIAPFVGASVRYISSKSKLSSQFTRKLGLGENGINW
ncbi:hypothetical protein [Runella zeae]|uniref:hypothetical protein n=1 Tax=Runella zeae TaxID=94255 RepID=UPI00040DC177|nr:hypothetical protein [Runella zeae]